MRLDNIDDIIKRGFKESERQNELIVNRSKSRVWNAIEKPKKPKYHHWGFVTAMAASVSLFLISVFLFYQLDLKQKELNAVHAQIPRGIPPIESTDDNPFSDEKASTNLEIEREVLPEPMPTDKNAKLPPQVYDTNLEELTNKKGNNRQLIPLPIVETIVMDFKTEMIFPEFGPPEMKEGLMMSGPSAYKMPTAKISKKQGKLKIRIGNGRQANSPHHSLALNLKL